MQLVDRAILEEVLEEHRLAVTEMLDPASGARLWDGDLGGGAVPGSEKLAAAIASAVLQQREGGPTVALVTVRGVGLGPERSAEADAVGLLLERELTAAARIAVLERSRLEDSRFETELADRPAQLRASLWTLHLDVSAAATGGLQGSLRAVAADGSEAQRIELIAESPAQLARLLAGSLSDALVSGPRTATPNASVEASRLLAESRFLWGHKRGQASVRAAEAALALNPDSQRILIELTRNLVDSALDPDLETEARLTMALRALHLLDRARSREPEPAHVMEILSDIRTLSAAEDRLPEAAWKLGRLKDLDGTESRLLERLRRGCLVYARQRFEEPALGLVKRLPEEFEAYTWALNRAAAIRSSCSARADDWTDGAAPRLSAWLELADEAEYSTYRFPFEALIEAQPVSGAANTPSAFELEAEQLRRFLDALEPGFDAETPVLRLQSRLWAIRLRRDLGELVADDVAERAETIVDVSVRSLTETDDLGERLSIYRTAMEAADLVDDHSRRESSQQRLFDLMVSREEIVHPVAAAAIARKKRDSVAWIEY